MKYDNVWKQQSATLPQSDTPARKNSLRTTRTWKHVTNAHGALSTYTMKRRITAEYDALTYKTF